MSPQEKITKLEGLLARVQQRARHGNRAVALRPVPAASTRSPAVAPVAPVAAAPTAPAPPVALSTPPHGDGPTIIEAAPRVPLQVSVPPLPETSGWSDPPPAQTDAPPATTFEQEAAFEARTDDSDVDVEVSAEVVEIDIDEPAHADHGFVPAESGAQPVAEHAPEHEPLPEDLSEELVATATSLPPGPAELSEPPPPPPAANEVVEPEPSSSPRPIATEIPDAYSASGEVPRHTPPPESGKQVAAPSVRPEPALRKSSIPPARVSAAPPPLSGGWREPGRVPPVVAAPVAQSVRLAPESTRGAIPIDANVVAIEGNAAAFKPATFGDLLDATLSL